MGICGVIGLVQDCAERLEMWFHQEIIVPALSLHCEQSVMVSANTLLRFDNGAWLACQQRPMFWSSNEGWIGTLTPQHLEKVRYDQYQRADDDCMLVYDNGELSLYSSCSGSLTLFYVQRKDYLVFATSIAQLRCRQGGTIGRARRGRSSALWSRPWHAHHSSWYIPSALWSQTLCFQAGTANRRPLY